MSRRGAKPKRARHRGVVFAAFLVFASLAAASAYAQCEKYQASALAHAEAFLADQCRPESRGCDADILSSAGYVTGRLIHAAELRGDTAVTACIEQIAVEMESLLNGYLERDRTYEAELHAALGNGVATGRAGFPAAAAFLTNERLDDNDYHGDVQDFAQQIMGIYGEDWHHCRHPEWREELGFTDLLVSGSVIADLGQGPGVVCDELYDNEVSSRLKACEMAAADPQMIWAKWVGGDAGVAPLECY
jgi:hypothetical protein